MNHKENKQTRNYFEHILTFLTTIRNVILLMSIFFILASAIDKMTQPAYCGFGIFENQYTNLNSTAYSSVALERALNLDKYYNQSAYIYHNSWYVPSIQAIPEYPIKPDEITRWKSWQNHRARMEGMLGY